MTAGTTEKTITVCVNGQWKALPQGITLKGVAERYGLNEKSVVFELNRKVVDRTSYSNIQLQERDAVEIVHLVGGG